MKSRSRGCTLCTSGLCSGRIWTGLSGLGAGLADGPASGLTAGLSAVALPGREGLVPGRVTEIGLSRSGFLNVPVLPSCLVAEPVCPETAGLVAGRVETAGLVEVAGRVAGRVVTAGRETVVLGLLPLFLVAGPVTAGLRSALPDGLADDDCLVTVADDFELPGLVSVTFVLREVVREVPLAVRDSPLRACAEASDSNAANANIVNIEASAVLIVLIIVQF